MALGDIVLLRDRTAHGPYTRAQIQEGLSRGEFTARDLAHTPGLKDWLPLLEVLHHLDRETVHVPRERGARILPPLPFSDPAAGIPPVGEIPVLANPGESASSFSIPTLPDLPVAPSEKAAPPPLAPNLTVPPALPRSAPPLPELEPAPLRQRFVAWIIDCAVLFVPVLAVFIFAYVVWLVKGPIEHRDPETARQEQALMWRNLRELVFMVAIGFAWIYAAGLESSRWQGTVGKQCMGLVVTDTAGRRLSFLHATGRHAAKYLSALPLFLGFMAASFNPQRLAWHDRLAGTRVVER